MARVIQVDIWSDVACPWCYIGKRRFEMGAASFAESLDEPPAVEVQFRSFELSPDMPVDFQGSAVDFLVRHKGISEDSARRMHQHVSAIAAQVGLDYDFGSLRPANTVKAHQVLHFSKARHLQEAMKERLLAAHFLEGRDVGRIDELAELAGEVGLDAEEVAESLADDEYLAAVREDQQAALRLGIRGVPFYVFDGRYGVSGAQAPEVFTRVLERVASGDE